MALIVQTGEGVAPANKAFHVPGCVGRLGGRWEGAALTRVLQGALSIVSPPVICGSLGKAGQRNKAELSRDNCASPDPSTLF